MPARRPPLAILLPPSEGKAEGGHGAGWEPSSGAFGDALGVARAQVAQALAAVDGGNEKLLGVGGKHLARAQSVNASLLGSPTMPAGRRYTGVVWDHLDLPSLPLGARRRARDSVVVVSGLLGLVQLDDPAPDYKLKIGASLAPMGKLSSWWRAPLSDALNAWLEGRIVVDLLPQEHRTVWVPQPERYERGITVTLIERSGALGGHEAKAAKGRLARHLLLTTGSIPRALATWEDDRFAARTSPL